MNGMAGAAYSNLKIVGPEKPLHYKKPKLEFKLFYNFLIFKSIDFLACKRLIRMLILLNKLL